MVSNVPIAKIFRGFRKMEGNKYRIEQIDRDRFAEIRKKFLHIIYNLSQTFYSQDQYITVSVPKTLLFEINDSDLFFFSFCSRNNATIFIMLSIVTIKLGREK